MRSKHVLLATALVLAVGLALPAAAQSTDAPSSPPATQAPATGDASRSPGMPGIYVTPTPPLRAPAARDGTGHDATGGAPSHGGGGCQYVPRKLDLIS